jgi:hypothetical protein
MSVIKPFCGEKHWAWLGPGSPAGGPMPSEAHPADDTTVESIGVNMGQQSLWNAFRHLVESMPR